jgi:hypothetical protein
MMLQALADINGENLTDKVAVRLSSRDFKRVLCRAN